LAVKIFLAVIAAILLFLFVTGITLNVRANDLVQPEQTEKDHGSGVLDP